MSCGDGGGTAMREKAPTPLIELGIPVTGTYVDNVQVIRERRSDVEQRMGIIADAFAAREIPFEVWSISGGTGVFDINAGGSGGLGWPHAPF